MYDPRPLFPDMYHPVQTYRSRDWKGKAKYTTRTEHPVRYYFIDFGLTRRYDPKDGPPREHPVVGGDKTVPEFKNWNGQLLDPFPTDIYYIGNMVRYTLLAVRGMSLPLVSANLRSPLTSSRSNTKALTFWRLS